MQSLLPLIPFLPFAGFLINGLFGRRLPKTAVGLIGSGTILGAFLLSLAVFSDVRNGTAMEQTLYTFLHVDSLQVQFAFLADPLSAWMMLIITGVGFLIHVYSIGYMHDDEGFWKFFAYLNLFVFSMLLLVMGDNFLMLFFGWEGVGLCSYLLIGFWYENRAYGHAARKAFIMNRIGDLGLLLGIFLIFNTFGSLQYREVFEGVANYQNNAWIPTVICLLLFVGAIGKSAQIPLYTWLPDAMAGPTPVSALIHAATMVTAGIYLVARCSSLYALAPHALEVIAITGLATAIFAALIGLRQNDIKKVLAYSTVSQLGLMFLALGMGAYSTAIFHVTTHAFFKALLFLGAGSVIHALGGEQDIRNMGGLRKALPVTFWVFVIGTLAISGFPLLSGFFSKDEIFAKTYEHSGALWWALAAISGLITATYMGRLLFVTFFGEFRGTEAQRAHLHESPAVMTIPLIVLAVLSVVGGFLNTPHFLHLGGSEWLSHYLAPALARPATPETHVLDARTEWLLMGITTVLALLVLVLAYAVYVVRRNVPVADSAMQPIARLLANKFYVDEAYDFLFVRPLEKLSKMLHYYADIQAIDGVVNGVGRASQLLGAQFRKLQNGNIEYYLLAMVVGAALLVGSLFI